jgi:hypothetical protein
MRSIAAALIAALPATAGAQDRPELFPTRDVTVTYHMSLAGGPVMEWTEQWSARLRAVRSTRTISDETTYWVFDYRLQNGFEVQERTQAIRGVLVGRPLRAYPWMENVRFTRGGSGQVAGLGCTAWHYQGKDTSGDACMTADGVLLRDSQMGMEAVNVAYGPLDPTLFRRPEGYRTTRPG